MRTLGRCVRKHVTVVDYEDGQLPSGTCKVATCNEPLTEWAVKLTTPTVVAGAHAGSVK